MHDPRRKVVSGWIQDLVKAGSDMEEAAEVLNGIRDDEYAEEADKEHFYRAVAQQSFLWYMAAIKGEPLSENEMKELAAHVEMTRQNTGPS